MSKLARILGWLLFAVLVFVTVCPITDRPHPEGMPVSLERIGAFALLGFVFAVGYPRHRWQVLAFTIAAAGLLEASQMLDPSRHARVTDFAVKAVGCTLGVVSAFALSCLRHLPAWARI